MIANMESLGTILLDSLLLFLVTALIINIGL